MKFEFIPAAFCAVKGIESSRAEISHYTEELFNCRLAFLRLVIYTLSGYVYFGREILKKYYRLVQFTRSFLRKNLRHKLRPLKSGAGKEGSRHEKQYHGASLSCNFFIFGDNNSPV